MERSRSPSRVPSTARAGSEQECSAEGPSGAPRDGPGPPHRTWFQFTVKQVSLSIASPWDPRELHSHPSQPLVTPGSCSPTQPPSRAPPAEQGGGSTAALKHSIKEPAGLSPGQSRAQGRAELPLAPAAALLLSDFLKGAKNKSPSKAQAEPPATGGPHDPTLSYCFAHPGQGGQGWSRTAGAEQPQSPPEQPPGSPDLAGPGQRLRGAGGQGQPWGQGSVRGVLKAKISPGQGLSPGRRGGEGRAAPQPLPWALREGRVGKEPTRRRHSGPCAQGAAGDGPGPREGTSHRGGTLVIVHGGKSSRGAGRPPGAQGRGHSGTQGSDTGEMMVGSKAAPPSRTRSQTRAQGPHLTSPSPSQPKSKGKDE